MPTARIPMKQIIEVLRLKYEAKLSHEKIARACQLSKGAVSKYVSPAKAKGVTWPLAEDVDEVALEALLFPAKEKPERFVRPDCFQIHQELKRKGVTLQLLWAEYVTRHGERAYRYTQFCHHYRKWRDRQKRSMRQQHRAGEMPISANVTADSGERDRLAHRSLTGVGFLLRPVTIGQVGGQFAHRLTPQVEAVRAVQQAVEDGICQGRLADVVVPVLGG